MQIRPFRLERYFAEYEFRVRYQLSASDCEALGLRELLALADDECGELWENLALRYTESRGHPLLRQARLLFRGYYRSCRWPGFATTSSSGQA